MNLAEIEKTIEDAQVRGFDVYVLGPFLIWYGLRSKGMHRYARRVMVTAGIWQIIYHWKQYKGAPDAIAQLPQKIEAQTNAEVVG